ncbi:MAG: hypothetical protein II260_05090 [Muribaculaceae bacterium]|nr:hypothetical protein [Muribaculaceae bacterium]
MKDAHIKYLQRGIKARILGNRVEIRSNSRLKSYKMLDTILNDARFYITLDFRRQWIGYATKRINDFGDSITVEEWRDEKLLDDRIERFLIEWFLTHFGELVSFDEDEETAKKSEKKVTIDGANDNEEEDEDDDELDVDAELNENLVSDKTSKDATRETNLNGACLPIPMQDFANKEPTEKTAVKYLESIDKSIVDLALKLGRTGISTFSISTTSKFSRSSHSDISGVTIGNDLNAILPTETALLGDSVTENVFYRKYVEKRLQVLASASSSTKGKKKRGPIIVCIDTSGSMTSELLEMAKQLALAVAIVAQRTHRTLCLINYSYNLTYFVLTNIKQQRKAFLAFLARTYGGGNNENLLFSFIFRSLLKGRKHHHLKDSLEGADLLVISDYMWSWLSKYVVKDLDKARRNGMRLYSLKVKDFNEQHNEHSFVGSSARKYMGRCYENYKYVGGKCIKETIK